MCTSPRHLVRLCGLTVPRLVCSHPSRSTWNPQPLPCRCRGLLAGSPDRQMVMLLSLKLWQLLFTAAVQANSKGIMRKEIEQAHGLICLHGGYGSHQCLV